MTKFVITIAVRNANSRYAKVYVGDFTQAPLLPQPYITRCLWFALTQEYPDYRIVIRDDASTDGTWETIQDIVCSVSTPIPIDMAQNPTRLGVIENHYQMAQQVEDNEVIVVLDGDDALAHHRVLTRVAEEYADPNVWMTYGSYENDEQCRDPRPEIDPRGHVRPMLQQHHIRSAPFVASHLRTYYRWLFARIRHSDLIRGTQLYSLIPDLVLMWPMVEMTGPEHCRYIESILYQYNAANPYNLFKGPGAWPTDTPAHRRIREEGEREFGHSHILVQDAIAQQIAVYQQEPPYPRLKHAKEWLLW